MIRGIISGGIWGGVVSGALGVALTQYGGRIDVVRAAVPPVLVDATDATAPTVDGSPNAQGEALGAAPQVGNAPRPGQQPSGETLVNGAGDVARPVIPSVDGGAAPALPEAEMATGPAADTASQAPRSPLATVPSGAADGLPSRVPDAPIAAAGADTVAAPDTPVLDGGLGDGADAPLVAPDSPTLAAQAPAAPTGELADAGVSDTTAPAAPGTMVAPGDPAAPGDIANNAGVSTGIEARPSTPRPAAPGLAGANTLKDDVLAALAPPDEVPPPRPRLVLPQIDEDPETLPATEGARSAARVVVNRLPRIGDPTPGEVVETPEADAAETGETLEPDEDSLAEAGDADREGADAPEAEGADQEPDVPQGTGALYDYSVAFERIEGVPVVAVVLIDDPNANTNFNALPIAVTIAVLSDSTGSVQRAEMHRDEGREVVLIPPVTGSNSRVEIARRMANAMAAVPEAVAVMDMPGQPFQRSRFAVGEVIVSLASTGHGMIVHPGGLNTAEQLASQQNVATNRVFRDIDGAGQDLATVKLALEQAAFQARQRDAVILIGRNRPDTVQALAEWVGGRSAESVSLAPVSAALKR